MKEKKYPNNSSQLKQRHHKSYLVKPSEFISFTIAFSIALITFIVFSPSLKCGFTNFDDNHFIVENPLIVNHSIPLKKIFTTVVTENDYYPITILSFAVNYKLGKLDPYGFHLLNVLLHILNTLLVFWFIFLLTKHNLLMAAFVALFFGIHPMHVESVTWVTERKDVLFLFFFLIALITYIRFKVSGKMRWYIITSILFILSCLSKGTAVAFPAILIIIDYFLFDKMKRKMFAEKIPFFVISAGFMIATYLLHKTGSLRHDIDERTLYQKFIFATYDTLWYIFKLILPTNLSAFYAAPKLNEIPIAFYVSPFILACLVAFIYFYLRKNKVVIFGFLFYFFSIALMLQFVPTGGSLFIMADRYSYLPSIGLLFIIAYLINISLQKKNGYRYLVIGITAFYFFLFSYQTFARTKVWQDSGTIWTNIIEKSPNNCYMAYQKRGEYYYEEKQDDEKALNDDNKSLELNPINAEAYNNRGMVYFRQGKYDLAMTDYNKALNINPRNYMVFINRGNVYLKNGNHESALKDYNQSLNLKSDYFMTYNNIATVYLNQGKFDFALENFSKAVSLNPLYFKAYDDRGSVYGNKGQYDLAIADFNKAIELAPSYFHSYKNRGLLYFILKQYPTAILDFSKVISMDNNDADAHFNRGKAYSFINEEEKAIDDFNSLVLTNPNNGEIFNARGTSYFKLKKYDLAKADFSKAIELGAKIDATYMNELGLK